MARSSSVLLVAMVCAMAAAPWQAQAHGGGFHDWDFSTPGYNYTRTLLATAGNFTFYNASLSSSFLPGDIPFFPSYAQAASIAGSVTVWAFLDTACRETVALSVNVNITAGNKQPVANEKVFIWGMVGSCVSGVLDTYKHNLTLGSQRGNMLWAARDTDFTNVNGTLWGTAPNIFYPRRVATADGPALTSLLVAFAPDVSPFLCADLKWANVNAAAWTKAKADCKPTGPGDRRRQLRQRATLMGREW